MNHYHTETNNRAEIACKTVLSLGFEPRVSRLQDTHANHYTRAAYTIQQNLREERSSCKILQPHLEGTIVLFKTHRPLSLPLKVSAPGAFSSQFRLCVATSAVGCLTAIYDMNQNFHVSVVPYFSLTMHLPMATSLTQLSKAARVPL